MGEMRNSVFEEMPTDFFFFLFKTTPAVYGSSQARG